MCYFITICLPESAVLYLQEEARPSMSAWRCENNDIMARVPSGLSGYILTTGMCSCDLYSAPLDEETRKEHDSKLKQKYKKKGWSELKIQRAIADANAAVKRKGLRDDARELIARVADESKKVYVFVHMYSGDQMTEKVTVKQSRTVSASEFRSGGYALEGDTMVTVEGALTTA
jgi:hypothetical protein